MLRRERHAHRLPSMVRGAMLARPTRRAIYHRALGGEKLRHSEGSSMLIGDPLGEGSSASSTDSELWRAENSFLRMRATNEELQSAENSFLRVRGNSDAPKGAACS